MHTGQKLKVKVVSETHLQSVDISTTDPLPATQPQPLLSHLFTTAFMLSARLVTPGMTKM